METISATTLQYPVEKNQVLDADFKASTNFYYSDKILRNHFKRIVSGPGFNYMQPHLEWTGKEAA